jgi:hypothetical protein
MLSPRLIQLVEANWKKIAESAISAVRADSRAPAYGGLAESELHDRAHEVLRNLGWWLMEADVNELHQRYVALGQIRRSQGVPVMEVIRKLQILKRVLTQFLEDQRIYTNAVELHAEYDVLKAVDVFFDEAIYAVLKGYSLPRSQSQELPGQTRVA